MDLAITLDEYESGPLYKQIYDEIRKLILYGRLQPGQKLPSTRELADSLKVSRITVTQSYDQLLAEGYITTFKGAGTFVSNQIPDLSLHCPPAEGVAAAKAREYKLSEYGERVAAIPPVTLNIPEGAIWFKVGGLNYDAFPMTIWKKLLAKYCRPDESILGYQKTCSGNAKLREAIADHLSRARAVNCSADRVLILHGTQQALHLCSRLLISPGDSVIIEEPCYPTARRQFQIAGANIVSIEVDEDGLVTDKLPQDGNCNLVFVTPSHQFPQGSVLSVERRLALLSWAQESNAIIIEDDYESELRYAGRPVPSLQGLDRNGSVIYAGTFSKVLFPALRLSYVVLPEPLIPAFTSAKAFTSWNCGVLEQHALADFIAEGHYERHLRKMRQIYGSLRQTLVDSLQKHFAGEVTIMGDSTGMHVFIRLTSKYSDDEILARALKQGVIIGDGRLYYSGLGRRGEFSLGYGSLTVDEIEEGIRRLALAIK